MEQKPYKSPYLPQRKADGVSIPLPKPDYDFEGAVSGFDYADPKIYPSSVDPDLEAGMGSSADGIYDTQYSLGGSILDVLLEDQSDALSPSAVMNAEKLQGELKQKFSQPMKSRKDIAQNDGTLRDKVQSSMLVVSPVLVITVLAFALGYYLK